jgi:hypothetical protein
MDISDKKAFLSKIFSLHKERILVFVALLAASALSFEAGWLEGSARQSEPLIIRLPAAVQTTESVSESPETASVSTVTPASGVEAAPNTAACVFVGSRNSDKYHLSTCGVAKRIKPENRVCFSSKEDAERRGYVAGCLK